MRTPRRLKSRKLTILGSLGAPFQGYDGPDFMQQTNFTAFVLPNEFIGDPTGVEYFNGEMNIAEMSPATNDLIVIELCVRCEATFAIVDTTFVVHLHDVSGADAPINPIVVASGETGIILARFTLPITSGQYTTASLETSIGSSTSDGESLNADGSFNSVAPAVMTIGVEADHITAGATLLYATATRIRAGI